MTTRAAIRAAAVQIAILALGMSRVQAETRHPEELSAASHRVGPPAVVLGSIPAGSVPVVCPPEIPVLPLNTTYDANRLLGGHLLRRIGFGPTARDINQVLTMGRQAYIDQQLHPGSIDDSDLESKLPPKGTDYYDDYSWMRRWYTRMVYSRRQLQEKMTLIWHEHFATSDEKVSSGCWMHEQEELLRKNSLGKFRDLLVGITKDQAMLAYLDNDGNNGRATDDEGNPIPPNENYAREFLQLFSLGTYLLNMDGTPVTDGSGAPVPAYTEDDVKAVARALTGWYTHWGKCGVKSAFDQWSHDSGPKTFLGVTIKGRSGRNGAREVGDVVEAILGHPSVAPFISKELILKLASETPTPGYVQRVATVFRGSGGDIRETVRGILTDEEFTSDTVVRTQLREPIEQFVGALRALGAHSRGDALIDWTYSAGQLVYYPPSVFSFYPPGYKANLVNTALVTIRDRVAEMYVNGYWDVWFDAAGLIKKQKLRTPEQAVDYLSDVLLAAPLEPAVRSEIIAYMGGHVDEEKFRGAVWLLLCSPDFQRN